MAKKEEPSLLLEFFGDRPFFRMVDFLLENRLQDFSKSEIARGAEVSWATLYALWPKFERTGLVKATRKVGNVTLYQLNEATALVKELKRVEMALMKQAAEMEDEKVKIKARAAR
jgi:DNA-binding transcriptional ArsR family regulator